jgi:hypothetical protein
MNQQLSTALADLPNFPMAATKPSPAHSRRCSVCRPPDCIWIELKFIEWVNPTPIAEQFNLYDRDCIYHHAHTPGRPGDAAPEATAQSSNSGSLENQHTPAHLPHSKRPKTPESWSSFRDKMRDPNITSDAKDAIVRERFAQLFTITGPGKPRPPD